MTDDGRLDLNLLTVFDAVMEERSLTRAGERLGMTQSAVSHALGRLRVALGDELFTRTGRGVRPTPRAQEIAGEISAALDRLRSALRTETSSFESATSDRMFHIDIPAGLDAILMPELARRTAGMSNINFRVSGNRANGILSELRHGECVLAVDYEPPLAPGYMSELLFEDPFVVLARKGHPALEGGLTLDRYQQLDHAGLSWSRDHEISPLIQRLGQLGVRRRLRYSVPTVAALPAIVEQGDVICTLARRLANAFAQHFAIELHEPPIALPPLPVHMVWHQVYDRDEGHRWLRGVMLEIAARLK